MRALAIALAAVVVLPVGANAQCAFDRPNGSSGTTAYLVSSLVRAFVSCNNPGGNAPNATTIAGIPSCYPVENFHQQAGSPNGGWEFRPSSSAGKVYLKRTTAVENIFTPPTTLRDAAITVKLSHIGNNNGGYATGIGSVMAYIRVTTQDYLGDDMTIIDFPFGFGISLNNSLSGSGSVTKKLGDILAGLNQPGFSDCTSIEILSIWVRDPNGNVFAVPGVRY
jgi:hypothetical protein